MCTLSRCLILFSMLAATSPTMSQRSRTDTLVIHFPFDRSIVRPVDSATLANAHPGADSILILGYTDTAGSSAYNLKLSRLRGEAARAAVLRSLASAQAPPIRLDARGEANPIPGNDSLSRRVEVFVFYSIPNTPAIAQTPVDTPRARPDDEPDTTFELEHIKFIANTPVLTDAAREAMPSTVSFLRRFTHHYLEIDGFCNSPGPPLPAKDPLFILSVQRAKFVYDYLIQQGFDSTHMRYKGLGNATPVVAHPTTREESDQNMRVEVRIFHKPPPQQ